MAPLTSAAINNLPDSAFAYIQPGGKKDSTGKTMPRSLRHFPVHDKAHASNALSRAPESPFGAAAMPKIKAAAAKFGIHVGGNRAFEESAMSEDVERRFIGEDAKSAYSVHDVGLQVREGQGGKRSAKRIGGYGAVFNRKSRNLGGFVEEIDPGAFQRSMTEGWAGAVCRYNHNPDMLLGTIAGRTLVLRTDSVGLDYEVMPPQSRADILELIERGDIRHSSFAFRVRPEGDEWSVTEQNYPLRRVHDVELVDVAPVVNPAYPDATAGLRSLAARFDAEYEEVRKMAEQDELRRFFVRTDPTTGRVTERPKPPKAGIFGAVAALDLMQRKQDPYADDEG